MRSTASSFFNYILISTLTFATDVYQSVRIFEPTAEKLKIIGSCGIPLDHVNFKRGIFNLENNGKVKSVENRMVVFPSHLMHQGYACSDQLKRVVINFNYD